MWGIAFTVKKTWAQLFYDMCLKERNKIQLNPIQKKIIVVSDACKQKLAQHEFISKCKYDISNIEILIQARVARSNRTSSSRK